MKGNDKSSFLAQILPPDFFRSVEFPQILQARK